MKYKNAIPFALLICALIACKQEASETTETPTEAAPSSQPATGSDNPNLVANMDWTFLTDKLFHHRVTVASGKSDKNTRKGHWMDFQEKGKYESGVWGEKTAEGSWTYDDNSKLLTLKPTGDAKPSEWRVMHKDNNLILVGTATYGNNAEQVQWIRNEARPDPNAKPEADEDL